MSLSTWHNVSSSDKGITIIGFHWYNKFYYSKENL